MILFPLSNTSYAFALPHDSTMLLAMCYLSLYRQGNTSQPATPVAVDVYQRDERHSYIKLPDVSGDLQRKEYVQEGSAEPLNSSTERFSSTDDDVSPSTKSPEPLNSSTERSWSTDDSVSPSTGSPEPLNSSTDDVVSPSTGSPESLNSSTERSSSTDDGVSPATRSPTVPFVVRLQPHRNIMLRIHSSDPEEVYNNSALAAVIVPEGGNFNCDRNNKDTDAPPSAVLSVPFSAGYCAAETDDPLVCRSRTSSCLNADRLDSVGLRCSSLLKTETNRFSDRAVNESSINEWIYSLRDTRYAAITGDRSLEYASLSNGMPAFFQVNINETLTVMQKTTLVVTQWRGFVEGNYAVIAGVGRASDGGGGGGEETTTAVVEDSFAVGKFLRRSWDDECYNSRSWSLTPESSASYRLRSTKWNEDLWFNHASGGRYGVLSGDTYISTGDRWSSILELKPFDSIRLSVLNCTELECSRQATGGSLRLSVLSEKYFVTPDEIANAGCP